MNCEILCIGTEILHGDIVNSNASFISKSLANIGIDVHYHSVVGDNPKRMREAFNLAFSRADIVICTGGLGPTKDDITKEILAEYFGLPMVFHDESMQHLKNMYSKFRKDMPENNLRQAYFPEGSIVLENKNGTANACLLNMVSTDTDNDKMQTDLSINMGYTENFFLAEKDLLSVPCKKNIKRKIGILLPGPPFEMTPLVTERILPYLSMFSKEIVVGVKVAVMNLGESLAETMIMDLIDNQTNPTIAPYAGNGKVIFRVTAKAINEEKAHELIDPVVEELLNRFENNAFIIKSDKIEDYVCEKLIDKKLSVAVAESCTGGLMASKFISYPGISSVFKEGYITYTNDSKIRVLGVKKETIDTYGAVSEETVKEMAKNICDITSADIGIATSGIAGPSGGTAEKPVGLVYVCVYHKGEYKTSHRVHTGKRDIVRERAALSAFELVRQVIE